MLQFIDSERLDNKDSSCGNTQIFFGGENRDFVRGLRVSGNRSWMIRLKGGVRRGRVLSWTLSASPAEAWSRELYQETMGRTPV